MYRIPTEVTGQEPVVYQLPKQTNKKRRPFLGGKPYSIWSASKYILMITLMLYWLPLVGQMIGGFIGGRRAGSPFRALLAAIIPVAVLYLISSALQSGFIPIKLQNTTYVAYLLIQSVLQKMPIASPYMNFATTYVGSFINELRTATSLKLGNYLITIAFAYVGGILSDQSRRELEYVSRYGSPTTNILVSGRESGHRREFQFPNPVSFLHALRPARRAQPAGFANLMPVAYSANGIVPARQSWQEMPRPVAQASTAAPSQVVRRRVAPTEPGPRSWEDVYLKNMRTDGVYGARVKRVDSQWGSRGPNPSGASESHFVPAVEMDEESPFIRERAPVRSPAPVIRRGEHLREESTRKLVERALGKDYLKQGGRGESRIVPAFHNGSARQHATGKLPETGRKNGEWELL